MRIQLAVVIAIIFSSSFIDAGEIGGVAGFVFKRWCAPFHRSLRSNEILVIHTAVSSKMVTKTRLVDTHPFAAPQKTARMDGIMFFGVPSVGVKPSQFSQQVKPAPSPRIYLSGGCVAYP